MKKRKQWLMLVCIALAVCLVSGGMLYIRQKNNNKKWSLTVSYTHLDVYKRQP